AGDVELQQFRRIQVQAPGARVVTQAAAQRDASAGLAATAQRTDTEVELQMQAAVAWRNRQPRVVERDGHQSAELVEGARVALVEVTLQLRRGEGDLVIEPGGQRAQAGAGAQQQERAGEQPGVATEHGAGSCRGPSKNAAKDADGR